MVTVVPRLLDARCCVAVRCNVLQYVAICCSVLQCVAVCCSGLQCVAVCCSVRCLSIDMSTGPYMVTVVPRLLDARCCVAVCCSVL